MKTAWTRRAIAVLSAGIVSATPLSAQDQCETPTPAGIAQCLESPSFRTNLAYRFDTRLRVALGVEYYQSQAWIDANYDYIVDKIDLTGKTGLQLSIDQHYRNLFLQSLGTALSVSEPFDIYLLMGQSNMTLHGQGTELKAAIQNFTDAVTQALGIPDRTVVTVNCSIPGTSILWHDPSPSPNFGSPTCETVGTLARCADPGHDPSQCDPANPELCSCDRRLLDFCSDGVSLAQAATNNPYSPFLTGDAVDRYNLTRYCLETAFELENTAGEHGTIKGMFYYQGEADTGSSELVASWGDSYENIVQFVRNTVGTNVPAVHAQLHGGTNPSANWQQLQVEQRLVTPEIANAAYVCTNDLATSDGVHLDAASHVTLGQRFGSAMLHLFFGYPYNPATGGCNPT